MSEALLAALILTIALAALERWRIERAVTAERKSWEKERATLLNRIQRPDLLPAPSVPFRAPPPSKDAANLAKIGTVARKSTNGD